MGLLPGGFPLLTSGATAVAPWWQCQAAPCSAGFRASDWTNAARVSRVSGHDVDESNMPQEYILKPVAGARELHIDYRAELNDQQLAAA